MFLGLIYGPLSSGVGDRELASIRGFSQTHKGVFLWYEASGHLLVSKGGQFVDPVVSGARFPNSPTRTYPSLSPDKKKVAFIQTNQPPDKDGATIWLVDVDGGILDKVTVLPWVNALSWSPKGDQLALTSEGLKVLTLADKHIRLITADKLSDGVPSWSPDGRKIVYESITRTGDRQSFQICVADLLSGEIKIIADGRAPSWSPQGDQIAYLDFKEQAYFSISPEGHNKKLLVRAGYSPLKGPLLGMWLVWSPDQRQAVYNTFYDGGVEAISVDLLTGKKHMIKTVGYFVAVDWRP
jgi:Tol biopolymer transport system component